MSSNETPSSESYVFPTKDIDYDASLEERLTDNVLHRIGAARYFVRDDDGEALEDWHGVFNRVATNVAKAEYEFGAEEDEVELWAEEFEKAMRQQRFMPNSPTLMNAGDVDNDVSNPETKSEHSGLQQLSACFVNSPQDSMDSIFGTSSEAAKIFKSGGGVGYAFHHLRPKGARVSSTGGVSSGPLSFMQLNDTTCGTVKQGGKRRGAQMGIMHVQHPDIGRFATAKRDEINQPLADLVEQMDNPPKALRDAAEGNLSNFNISMAVTDDFVEAVKNDEQYEFKQVAEHGMSEETFEVVPETKHFYSPEYEDAWNEDFDKPATDDNGKLIEENLWRDFDVPGIEKYKDQIDLTVGESMELPAGLIMQLLADGAWANGEPGFFHIDQTNREHSFDVDEHPEYYVDGTNPCAEQPLMEYEACNLGHVNLSLMADPDAKHWSAYISTLNIKSATLDEDNNRVLEEISFEEASEAHKKQMVEDFLDEALDNELFVDTIHTGTRFLDNVVTQSEFPLDEITSRVKDFRKIGLGLMGYHQLLIQLGIEYGTEPAYLVAEEIMRRIDKHATQMSHQLALERGTFEAWEDSKYAEPTWYPDWNQKHAHINPSQHPDGYEVRNHNMTTIAPTGTTSMIGDTTGGCEPIFSVSFFKNVGDDIQGDEMLVEFDDYFLRVLEANDIDVDAVKEQATDLMMNNEFEGVDSIPLVPDEIAEKFVTTQELDSEQHVLTQAAFQKRCDSGISKTLNLPNDATREDVSEAILLALDNGIKGATVYRDGSRNEQVKTTRLDNNLDEEEDVVDAVKDMADDLDDEQRDELVDVLTE